MQEVLARPSARLSQRACCLKKLFGCQEHRAAGVKLLPAPAREGLSGLEAPLNLQRTFFLENLVLPEEKFLKTSPPN